jgi:hypothetical protein
MSLTSVISMHRLKWEWDALTTLNQFVASVVHLFHSKNVRSIVRNKRQGKLSFKKAMEGAKRWVYSSETTVR